MGYEQFTQPGKPISGGGAVLGYAPPPNYPPPMGDSPTEPPLSMEMQRLTGQIGELQMEIDNLTV